MRNSYGRSLNDSHSLDDFLLVHFRTGTIKIPDNSAHASLVAHRSSEMDRFLRIVLGKALDLNRHTQSFISQPCPSNLNRKKDLMILAVPYLSTMTACALPWQKGQRAMTRRFELSVGHPEGYAGYDPLI